MILVNIQYVIIYDFKNIFSLGTFEAVNPRLFRYMYMSNYNIVGVRRFYGLQDRLPMLDVKQSKVVDLIEKYLCVDCGCSVVFIYEAKTGLYLGSYSSIYSNYTDINRKRHNTFPF